MFLRYGTARYNVFIGEREILILRIWVYGSTLAIYALLIYAFLWWRGRRNWLP